MIGCSKKLVFELAIGTSVSTRRLRLHSHFLYLCHVGFTASTPLPVPKGFCSPVFLSATKFIEYYIGAYTERLKIIYYKSTKKWEKCVSDISNTHWREIRKGAVQLSPLSRDPTTFSTGWNQSYIDRGFISDTCLRNLKRNAAGARG